MGNYWVKGMIWRFTTETKTREKIFKKTVLNKFNH